MWSSGNTYTNIDGDNRCSEKAKIPQGASGCECTDASARALEQSLWFSLEVEETDVIPTCVTHSVIVHELDGAVWESLNPTAGSSTEQM